MYKRQGVNHANIIIADDELRARFTDRRTRDHYGSLDPCVYELSLIHIFNEHDILCLRQEFIDLDGGLQLEGDVGIIERYTKQLFKLF